MFSSNRGKGMKAKIGQSANENGPNREMNGKEYQNWLEEFVGLGMGQNERRDLKVE
jgi:hypothetical protein